MAFSCPFCGSAIKRLEDPRYKKMRCPKCGQIIPVAAAPESITDWSVPVDEKVRKAQQRLSEVVEGDSDPKPGKLRRVLVLSIILLVFAGGGFAFWMVVNGEPSPTPSLNAEKDPGKEKDSNQDAPSGDPATKTLLTEIPPKKSEPETPKDMILPFDQAIFMGTAAKGSRFCIIADASHSIKGAPLSQLKEELFKTLKDLKPTSQFYIIFFNAGDIPMPYPTWLNATRENYDKVKPWILDMGTALKTQPRSAFQRAFALNPPPDVIFLMSDGYLQGIQPKDVAQMNQATPKVVVHTIMFNKGGAPIEKKKNPAEQLRSIAELNGGTFRHVQPLQ